MARLLVLLCALFVTGCDIYGFGDSISTETPDHNAAWIHRLGIPDLVGIQERGQPWATCRQVYENFWTDAIEAGEMHPFEIVVVMCHTPDDDLAPIEDAVEAVAQMHAEARERGLQFVYATQPAWHVSQAHLQPDSAAFYDAVWEALPDVAKVDNYDLWIDEGWDLDASLYTDGVHMSERGGELLGAIMRDALCGGSVVLFCEEDQ